MWIVYYFTYCRLCMQQYFVSIYHTYPKYWDRQCFSVRLSVIFWYLLLILLNIIRQKAIMGCVCVCVRGGGGWGTSNEYPQHTFCGEIRKISALFGWKTGAMIGTIEQQLIMKYFLRSFSPFRWFKKGSCQFLAKECVQYWLYA